MTHVLLENPVLTLCHRTKLYTFWSSVITVIIPVLYKFLVTMFSDAAANVIDEMTKNMTCTEIAREILRDRST